MPLFAIATLLPAALLAAAALWGGVWVWLALGSVTIVVTGLDGLVRRVTPARDGEEFPAGTALSVTLALAHFAVLALVVRAFGGGVLGLGEKALLLVAAGLWIGQVGNANAHELIHRRTRALHRLGMWVYVSILYGHHTSAHVLIHHRHVATPGDPATARLGEGFYRYALRAWRGAFRAGLRAERARLARVGRSRWENPYVTYVAGGCAALVAAALIGGAAGLLGYVLLVVHAQSQLLLSDYVQHYGLRRATDAEGRPEPVAARHSWNSGHWFSSAFMLNAPRHSDHHAHPARPYPALALPADAPLLPSTLPVMAVVALVPPLWRRVMDRRVAEIAA